LNEFILGIWLPGVLADVGNPNGIDKGAKEKGVSECSRAGSELDTPLDCGFVGACIQLGTLEQLLRFLWILLWQRP
jgi:hypothetical protein